MRILGIDPGSRATGYGLIEKEGNRLIHIDNGVIRPPEKADLPERLQAIFTGINAIIDENSPQNSAVEQVFMSQNAQSALKLGQARGAALLALANAGLEVGEYSPMQVKIPAYGQRKSCMKIIAGPDGVNCRHIRDRHVVKRVVGDVASPGSTLSHDERAGNHRIQLNDILIKVPAF